MQAMRSVQANEKRLSQRRPDIMLGQSDRLGLNSETCVPNAHTASVQFQVSGGHCPRTEGTRRAPTTRPGDSCALSATGDSGTEQQCCHQAQSPRHKAPLCSTASVVVFWNTSFCRTHTHLARKDHLSGRQEVLLRADRGHQEETREVLPRPQLSCLCLPCALSTGQHHTDGQKLREPRRHRTCVETGSVTPERRSATKKRRSCICP